MLVIGITGTIGSGKSTVCSILAALGCPVIDADREAHASYRRGTLAYRAIVDTFGPGVLDGSGRVNRAALGAAVFSDPESRRRLNAIVHPATRGRVERKLQRLKLQGHAHAAVEATLLVEAGWRDMVHRLWVVAAADDNVILRLRRDRGQDEGQVRQRLEAQTPVRQMMERADDIIINDGDLSALRARVTSLYSDLDRPRVECHPQGRSTRTVVRSGTPNALGANPETYGLTST